MSASSDRSSPDPLEFLRKDAKHLVRRCRSGDAQAIARLRTALPRLAGLDDRRLATTIRLADAHQAIAIEHGLASWGALTRHGDALEQLLVAVRGGTLSTIVRDLSQYARLSAASVHAAAALGDRDALESLLDRDPAWLTVRHRDWPPLMYACASPLHRLTARHSAGLLDCARSLLDRGADPNTTGDAASQPKVRAVPALERAAAAGNYAVMLLLMRRGATEPVVAPEIVARMRRDRWAAVQQEYFARPDVRAGVEGAIEDLKARLGHPHGHFVPLDIRPAHTPPWARLPGAPPGVTRLIPDHPLGVHADEDGGRLLHQAVRHMPAGLVALLLERGASTSYRDSDGRTALAAAIRSGNDEAAAALRRHGVSEEGVTPIDELIGACIGLDAERAVAIAAALPDLQRRLSPADREALVQAAATNAMPQLALLLDAGLPPGGVGSSGATALHVAAWHGHVDAVRLLLERGAPADARDATFGDTPLAWARHGSVHCRDADAEYQAIMAAIENARDLP